MEMDSEEFRIFCRRSGSISIAFGVNLPSVVEAIRRRSAHFVEVTKLVIVGLEKFLDLPRR